MRDDWTPTPLSLASLFEQPLPAADRDGIGTYNQVVRGTHLADMQAGPLQVSCRISALPRTGPPPSWRISAALADQRLTLDCGSDVFALLFGDSIDLPACTARDLRVLVHLLCARVGGALDGLVGDRAALDVAPYPADATPRLTVGIDLHVAGRAAPARVDVGGDLALLLPLVQHAPSVATPKLSDQIRLTCRAVSTTFGAVQSPLPTLARGDLIFLDAMRPEGLFTLHAAGRPLVRLTLKRGKLTVVPPPQEGDHTMDHAAAPPASEPTPEQAATPEADTAGMTSDMTLEVGDWPMSLEAIDSLTPGTVLDIGAVDTNAVKIRLNGDIVATGALIDLGTGMGVQIRSLI
ncbi:MAG: FliM/FliN family flagellar motor switch protein [Pseudomonadota bacterium]